MLRETSLNMPHAIDIHDLSHRYADRVALDSLRFTIEPGELFAILGPNGSGKSTLFRLLSTLVRIQSGEASIFDFSLRENAAAIRALLGVVFQHPSLDKKLTVAENIRYQAALYGISGSALRIREQELLDLFGLADRARDYCEQLSGGLKRRVEIAKGMVHRPRLMLLDEPSTGLDPAARLELWQALQDMQRAGMTVVLTTHLLDEAAKADRVAIFDEGRLVACDTPSELQASVGRESLTLKTSDAQALANSIQQGTTIPCRAYEGFVRIDTADAHREIPRLVDMFGEQIQELVLGRPTLEDVFLAKTGKRFLMSSEGRR